MNQATAVSSTRSTPEQRITELEREIVELQAAITFLVNDARTFRYALGGIIQKLWGGRAGTLPNDIWAAGIVKSLYPEDIDSDPILKHCSAPRMSWNEFRTPARLWNAYGDKERMRELAAKHGVKFTSREPRRLMAHRLLRAGVRPDGTTFG